MDTRRLQRTLFRMQADPAFAARVLARDAEAVPELGPRELELLLRADPAGIGADRGGRRQAQILGNLASEYVLTVAETARGPLGAGFLLGFPASDDFHRAVAEGRALPLAFGAWVGRRARSAGDGPAAAMAALDTAMVRARRETRAAAVPKSGEVALSPRAWLVTLPSGAFSRAQALREALDAGREAPPRHPELESAASRWLESPENVAAESDASSETVLLVVDEVRRNHRLGEVAPELLEKDVADLLRVALAPLDAATLARLAAARDWPPESVAEFVSELVADGVLRHG